MPRRPALVECCTLLAGSSLSDDDAGKLERLLRTIADRARLRILSMFIRAGGEPVMSASRSPSVS